ncbi:MAG: hypothetical protein K2X86_08320 [Cytophagaceae bacterium]|nr:hypothetical protein [Cytophagaceae bacterium]
MKTFFINRKDKIFFASRIILMLVVLMLSKLSTENMNRKNRIGKKEFSPRLIVISKS